MRAAGKLFDRSAFFHILSMLIGHWRLRYIPGFERQLSCLNQRSLHLIQSPIGKSLLRKANCFAVGNQDQAVWPIFDLQIGWATTGPKWDDDDLEGTRAPNAQDMLALLPF
jgi:hypothetical protein